MHTPPVRPQAPTREDNLRVTHTLGRVLLLTEDADEVAADWAAQHLSREQLESWGPMDTSTNPLSDYARQLSTPGHYTLRPQVVHPDPAAAPLLAEEVGLLDASALWSNLQHVQYMVLGAGDWVLVPEVMAGGLGWRHVNPANCYAMTRPENPGVWIGLWELRMRTTRDRKGDEVKIYTWDVWDLTKPEAPSLRIYAAKPSGGLGDDMSGEFLIREGFQLEDGALKPIEVKGPIEGADYPWRYQDGTPFIPHVRYTAWDTGAAWNSWILRGAYRGSLNSILFKTFAGRAALDAVGTMVVTVGVIPPTQVQGVGERGASTRIPVTPGMWAACKAEEGVQPTLWTIGPGQNLEALSGYSNNYDSKLGARWGLNQGEVTRSSGNPWSAAALFVTDADKRREAARSAPCFKRCDRELLRKVAALLRITVGLVVPETGYSITYIDPPESPEMQRSKREGLEWRETRGLASPIDTMIELNPGLTREAAATLIVRARLESARLDRMVAEALAAEGLDETPAEQTEADAAAGPPTTTTPTP